MRVLKSKEIVGNYVNFLKREYSLSYAVQREGSCN